MHWDAEVRWCQPIMPLVTQPWIRVLIVVIGVVLIIQVDILLLALLLILLAIAILLTVALTFKTIDARTAGSVVPSTTARAYGAAYRRNWEAKAM